MQIDSENSGH